MTRASCCAGAFKLPRVAPRPLGLTPVLLLASLVALVCLAAAIGSPRWRPARNLTQVTELGGKPPSDGQPPPLENKKASAEDGGKQNDKRSTERAGFKVMRAIFDFGAYKRLFHRNYSTMVEELARRKYFLSRAFRVFISAIKYKHRQLTYYLAVNHMSDLSPRECAQMDNSALEEPGDWQLELLNQRFAMAHIAHAEQPPALPEFNGLADADEVEAEIEEFFELEHPATIERDLLDLSESSVLRKVTPLVPLVRRKRQVTAGMPPRPKRPMPDEASTPVSGPLGEMSFVVQRSNRRGPAAAAAAASEAPPSSSSSSWEQDGELEQLEDEVFVDHRRSGCMFEPRGQGRCGSCYSFSMIAYMEWLYCFKTRKLLAFSEQYLIDCGKRRVGNLNGCSGGGRFSIGDFVMNFGLELRSSYPYRMREEPCPYSQETRLQETGSFRWRGLETGSSIPVELWPVYLRNGPMVVSLSTTNTGFKEYGGGIYDGAQCEPAKANHMMLLVGHGREDNQEYWLIRNSYTVGWGERGHYKLSKRANCVYLNKGFMYGTSDGGRSFTAEPIKNALKEDKLVREHYAQNLARDLNKWAPKAS